MYRDDLLNQLQNILIQMSAIGCFSYRFNGGSFAPSGRECQLRRGLADQKCQQQSAPTDCDRFFEYKLHAFRVALRRGQNGLLSKFSLDLPKTLHLCSQSDERHRQTTPTHASLIDIASLLSFILSSSSDNADITDADDNDEIERQRQSHRIRIALQFFPFKIKFYPIILFTNNSLVFSDDNESLSAATSSLIQSIACFESPCFPIKAASKSIAPRVAAKVLHNMYVDDLATSCKSLNEARRLAAHQEELMASGGFHRTSGLATSRLRLVQSQRKNGRQKPKSKGCLWKTLGIYLDHKKDHLTFISPDTVRRDGRDSKPQLLRTASSIFDLLGSRDVLGRTLARGRGLTVGQGKREMKELPLIKVPCTLVPVPLVQVKRVELHAFCDTSELAYGTVVYLRAALDLQVHSTTYSSDSEVALAWVRSAANSGKPFGRNRVEEIQQLVEPASWRHCPGKNNPADWLSRGVAVTKLVAGSQWWHGPRWLAGLPQTWPRKQEDSEHGPLIPPEEERTAHCRRFTKNCCSPARERQGARELQDAEEMWVRLTQEEEFRAEIEALVHHGRVAAHSRISQFDPYMDECGVLRAWEGAFGELRFVGVHAIPGNPPGESRVDRWIDSPMSPAAATCRGGADTGFPPTTLLGPEGTSSSEAHGT
ncbi:hypothetical protein T03_347 [Trichinella britovi]|uniref:Uncharacterized protein n=1 Tax=Trichinella britovi TaxID=45882 RepID=A0A0V1DGH2_TRIBR|nr:hypothetical protein T03_347 [Trichinella britovi]